MKSNAGGPAIGIAGTEIQSSATNTNKWIAIREKLHSMLLSPPPYTTGNTPKERDGFSQFEAHSRTIVGCNELWSQFQTEARAYKIYTTAGVKEMLKLKQAKQQYLENDSVSRGGSTIDSRGSTTLISTLKTRRLSDSEISWRERKRSFGSISSSGSGRKKDFPCNVRQPRHYSNISEFFDDESGGTLPPFLPIRSPDIEDYCEAIRGNTQNVLSLYSSHCQNNMETSTTIAHKFRTLKEEFEQKQAKRQQQQGNESNASVPAGGIYPIKAQSTMSLRSSLKPSRFSGSHVGLQRRASSGDEITRCGNDEFFEMVISPHRPFFLDEDYERNNASKNISTIRPTSKVTIVRSAQFATHPQANKESTSLKLSQDEQDSDFSSSDGDDTCNNGRFEYCPCHSRQKARERSIRSSATSFSSIESSLLVEWSDAGELNNGCEYPCHSRQNAVEKSMRSSVTSWSTVGSSLLVEWSDAGYSSDDSD